MKDKVLGDTSSYARISDRPQDSTTIVPIITMLSDGARRPKSTTNDILSPVTQMIPGIDNTLVDRYRERSLSLAASSPQSSTLTIPSRSPTLEPEYTNHVSNYEQSTKFGSGADDAYLANKLTKSYAEDRVEVMVDQDAHGKESRTNPMSIISTTSTESTPKASRYFQKMNKNVQDGQIFSNSRLKDQKVDSKHFDDWMNGQMWVEEVYTSNNENMIIDMGQTEQINNLMDEENIAGLYSNHNADELSTILFNNNNRSSTSKRSRVLRTPPNLREYDPFVPGTPDSSGSQLSPVNLVPTRQYNRQLIFDDERLEDENMAFKPCTNLFQILAERALKTKENNKPIKEMKMDEDMDDYSETSTLRNEPRFEIDIYERVEDGNIGWNLKDLPSLWLNENDPARLEIETFDKSVRHFNTLMEEYENRQTGKSAMGFTIYSE